MTFDETPTKFWNKGEYEPLDPSTLEDKMQAHALHCPYGGQISTIATSDNRIIFEGPTQDFS